MRSTEQRPAGGSPGCGWNDRLLFGDDGYWTHWWNMMHDRPEGASPLAMDVVVADDGWFPSRDWVGEFDREIVDYVVTNRLMTGRAIVAPGGLDTPAGDVVQLVRSLGIEVRIFSSPTHYVVYDNEAAVLREAGSDGLEGHRLTRCGSTVGALRRLFSLQWSMGMPWHEAEKGSPDLLQLLGEGLTDAQVARAMNVSVRTVSRRVTELMRASGARSRFELGMRFARAELARATD